MNTVTHIADQPMVISHTMPVTAVTPMDLVSRAVLAGNVSIEVLERLMVMQEAFEQRRLRAEFDEALSKAKGEIGVIEKKQHVGFESKKVGGKDTDYWHEDMAGIAEAIDPILAEHGITYRFRTSSKPNEPIVVTCIVSRGGYFEENTLSAGRDDSGNKNPVQQIGSTVTYLQRYTLKAALGLAAGRDDDGRGGNGAPDSKPAPVPGPSAQQAAPAPKPAAKPEVSQFFVPFEGMSFPQYARAFLNHVEAANVINPAQASQWVEANREKLALLANKAPDIFSRLMAMAPPVIADAYKPKPVPVPSAAAADAEADHAAEGNVVRDDDGERPTETADHDPQTGEVCPEYKKDPEGFVKFVDARLRERIDREGLNDIWGRFVEAEDDIVPLDRSYLNGVMKVLWKKFAV